MAGFPGTFGPSYLKVPRKGTIAPSSRVFDSALTQAAGTLVRAFGWYDNSWGYASCLADLAVLVGSQLQVTLSPLSS
jgi:glyceraldehyde-3-phosphate dehydrogenase/erythrose-4-phosphate dehydrogenase